MLQNVKSRLVDALILDVFPVEINYLHDLDDFEALFPNFGRANEHTKRNI